MLEKAVVSTIPNASGLRFNALVFLAATRQRLVEGSPLDASLLRVLCVCFSPDCAPRTITDSPSIFDLTPLLSLNTLFIQGAGHFDRRPIGGKSASVTSVTVEAPQEDFNCRVALLEGVLDTVERLTFRDVDFDADYWEAKFSKLKSLALVGCCALECLRFVLFPSLNRLLVEWGDGTFRQEQMEVVSILSASAVNKRLKHLDLNFEHKDMTLMTLMTQDLEKALATLTTLLSFHMRGALAWSAFGWKRFACSNRLLRGVALTIGKGVEVSLPSLR
jgi:hypothetical protein